MDSLERITKLNEIIVDLNKELTRLPIAGSVAWEHLAKARLMLANARDELVIYSSDKLDKSKELER